MLLQSGCDLWTGHGQNDSAPSQTATPAKGGKKITHCSSRGGKHNTSIWITFHEKKYVQKEEKSKDKRLIVVDENDDDNNSGSCGDNSQWN